MNAAFLAFASVCALLVSVVGLIVVIRLCRAIDDVFELQARHEMASKLHLGDEGEGRAPK